MRVIFIILMSLWILPGFAQVPLDDTILNGNRPAFGAQLLSVKSSPWHKQWQVSSYGGLNTSYGLLKPGNLTALSAPVGLQLTRRLTQNWFAFAGISAAPAFFSLNSALRDPGFHKTNSGSLLYNTNRFGVYSGAEAGFLYVNDAQTFSISGSIHMDRTSYPLYPHYPSSMNARPAASHSF